MRCIGTENIPRTTRICVNELLICCPFCELICIRTSAESLFAGESGGKAVLTDCSQENAQPRLRAQIDDLHELVALMMPLPQRGLEIANGFSATLPGGFPRTSILNAIARSDEHVPGFRESAFCCERPCPRQSGVIVSERENFVGSGIMPVILPLTGSM